MKNERSCSRCIPDERITRNVRLCRAKIWSYFKAVPPLNVWQWAAKHRYLAKGVSNLSKDGRIRYRPEIAPHQIAIQEAFTDPLVQCTVMIGASQIMGKTEIINNVLGYHIHWKPTSCVVMYPTIEASEKYSKKKFTPMISASPGLSALILPARERDSGNTILVKEFPGGAVFFVGANSTPSLRGASGEVLIADEIDSNKGSAGDEGDPIELLWKRGESFPGCIKILSSTPTIKNHSEIEKAFESSDKQFWEVACPLCNAWQVLQWSQINWPKGEPEKAVLLCASCGKSLTDDQRIAMYYAGRWKATAPFKGIRGYHFTGLYCMWPAQRGYANRLHQFAVEHMRAVRKGAEALRVWTNTFLAESFEEETSGPSHEPLLARREEYGPSLPAGVLVLTCAVDVQRDRLELEVKGWGRGQESWGIRFRRLMGNTNQLEVWQQLEEFLALEYDHPSETKLRVVCCVIDSGDASTQKSVYSFVRPRQARRCFAIKGSSTPGAPVAVPRLQKNKILLYSVGSDTAKSTFYERLHITEPGPRYCHWPIDYKLENGDLFQAGYEEEYFRQCVAERIRIRYIRGFPVREWVKVFERNEGLDLNAYNIAAFDILNPDLATIANQLKPKDKPKEYILGPPNPKPDAKPQSPKLFRFRPHSFSK